MESKTNSGSKLILILLALLTIASVVFCVLCATGALDVSGGNNSGASSAETKLVLYDGPSSLPTVAEATKDLDPVKDAHNKPLAKSTDTKISVCGKELFVYETGVGAGHTWTNNFDAPQKYVPMTYFDLEGTATIEVDVSAVAELETIKKVEVLPSKNEITPTINGKKISFNVSKAGSYTVVFNSDDVGANDSPFAVHIFVNDFETFVPDEDTIVIGPGEWWVDNINLESDTVLYISGGAVVHTQMGGNFIDQVKITGRGIVDGSQWPGWKESDKTAAHVPFNIVNATGITLEGLTFTGSNCWVINAESSGSCMFDNIKVISGRANGDGITIQSSKNMIIQNSFVRSWDDSLVIKNYTTFQNSDSIKFNHMVVWTDLAQSMEIGYETNKGLIENPEIKNITFNDVCVLFNFHKPVMSIHNSDNAYVHNITYKDIVVEHANMGKGDGSANPQLIDLTNDPGGEWVTANERGKISDILFDNIQVLNSDNPSTISRIVGIDAEHDVKNVTIKDLVILGKKITNENKGDKENKFELNQYATNIVFE